MNEGINLLASTKKPKAVEPANIRIVRWIGLSILFVIAGAAIVLFILISFSRLPSLQKEEKELVAELSQYRTQVASLTVVSQRAKDLKKFLTSRKDYPEMVNLANSLLREDATLVSFESDTNKLSLTFASTSLASLDSIINNLNAINAKKKIFTSAKMKSLSIGGDLAQFILKIELVLV
jgi:hypothetical protein